MPEFKVVSPFEPGGDQPQAIEALAMGVENDLTEQTLLGVTGSGKTYTMAKVIEKVQRPTLVLAHNKILAAQLCAEFKEFFPNNAVEYFVSYYDYYQPEAYIPHTDTFIEKDSSVNDEIDRLRLSATASLIERRDVIVVSSVSCIYGLGEPDDYAHMMISLRVGEEFKREELMRRLIEGFVMNFACYVLGWKVLGKNFIIYSMVAGCGFSVFYAIFEYFGPLWPQLSDRPLIAAFTGALFVGVGVGLSVRAGGAPGGDDALAMSLAHITHKKIQWIYLISDLAVLVLSASYIPLNRLVYSLLTVLLSGQIIGLMQRIDFRNSKVGA